ncbi:hypothetical protein [Agaribacter flavus]|uniref:Tetratricopeptide repeat protein n=1 Tax=Agaribacter flavus TaxID=1902781 RepID=A0ABV7FUW3_9ALTE
MQENSHSQAQSARKTNKLWLLVLGLFALVFGVSLYKQWPLGSQSADQSIGEKTPWDDRLLACNDVESAEETDAFNTCLSMAKEGWPHAQKKVAWAYTRKGEFQDWKKAYDWVIVLSKYEQSAELLRYVMLLSLGQTEEDKTFGEKGIKRLANINYGPAAAYLGALYKLDQNTLAKTSSAIWLFKRAYEQAPELFSAFDLAAMYSNGFGVEKNYEKARNVLLKHADLRFPITTNNVAWYFATIDSQALLMPQKAIALAKSVTNDENHKDNHVYIDTLAAAYAANEEFELAESEQERALALLLSASENDTESTRNQNLIKEYEERLASYKNKERAVTISLYKESDKFFSRIKRSIENGLLRTLNKRAEAPTLITRVDD